MATGTQRTIRRNQNTGRQAKKAKIGSPADGEQLAPRKQEPQQKIARGQGDSAVQRPMIDDREAIAAEAEVSSDVMTEEAVMFDEAADPASKASTGNRSSRPT